jgi:hypothetical protein
MENYVVLEKALALIEPEENWCQVELEDEGRVCLNGALIRASTGLTVHEACGAGLVGDGFIGHRYGLDELAIERYEFLQRYEEEQGMPTAIFNDRHSHAEVLDFLKLAIRRAKAKVGIPVDLPEPTPAPTEVPA